MPPRDDAHDLTDEQLEQLDHGMEEELERLPNNTGFGDEDLGITIFSLWQHAFGRCSVNNEFYGSGAFHLVFGQLPNIRGIRIQRGNGSYRDPRVHLAFLAPSGTGKGEGLKFISRLCLLLDTKLQIVDRVTDAGLLGTWRRDEEGELHQSEGWLHPNSGINILAAKEASNLIKDPSKDREAADLMNTLQSLMGDMGDIDAMVSKKLAEGDAIEFGPVLSLLLTTFPLEYMDEVLLKRGLFQRMYLVIREASLKDRMADSKRLREILKERVNMQDLEMELAKRLLAINTAYAGVEEMFVSAAALEVFEAAELEVSREILRLPPAVQDMLTPFISRFEHIQTKVAMHFACLNLHQRVEEADAKTAIRYTRELFQDLMTFIQLHAKPDKKTEERVKRITEAVTGALEEILASPNYKNSKGFVPVDLIIKRLMKRHHMTENSANTYLKKLDSWSFGQFAEKDETRFFRMRPEVAASLKEEE